MASLIQTFQRVKGSGKRERFINLLTGEEVSRRQRDQAVKQITYEKKAIANKAINEAEQLARPARGRTSVRKLAPAIKAGIVKVRKEQKQEKAQTATAQKELRAVERKVERAKVKKVKTPKISKRLLKPGKISRTVDFDDQDKLDEILEQVRATPEIFAYYLGFDAVHKTSGNRVDITLWRREEASNIVTSDEFDDAVQDYLTEHPYLEVATYWIRLVFYEKFASKLAADKGVKWQIRK